MRVSADVLRKLKDPFGLLIPDRDVTRLKVRNAVKGATMVVAVGDATTERLVEFGLVPDLSVVDGLERRSRRVSPINYSAAELRTSNPPGSISAEAVDVLKRAIRGKHPSRVTVDGEEDLLALPIFNLVPKDSVVLYGQPLEGLVVVRMTAAKRKEAKALMGKIEHDYTRMPDLGHERSREVNRKRSKPKKSN